MDYSRENAVHGSHMAEKVDIRLICVRRSASARDSGTRNNETKRNDICEYRYVFSIASIPLPAVAVRTDLSPIRKFLRTMRSLWIEITQAKSGTRFGKKAEEQAPRPNPTTCICLRAVS
jgi:hypothetical protein